MASSETAGDTGPAWGEGAVTPSYLGKPNTEMDIIGWTVFLVLLVVMAPLVPFALLAVALLVTGRFLRRQTR